MATSQTDYAKQTALEAIFGASSPSWRGEPPNSSRRPALTSAMHLGQFNPKTSRIHDVDTIRQSPRTSTRSTCACLASLHSSLAPSHAQPTGGAPLATHSRHLTPSVTVLWVVL